MKRVKVLRPFDVYAVGDTPTLLGRVARDRRERGDVEWLDDVSTPLRQQRRPNRSAARAASGGAKTPAPKAKSKK